MLFQPFWPGSSGRFTTPADGSVCALPELAPVNVFALTLKRAAAAASRSRLTVLHGHSCGSPFGLS